MNTQEKITVLMANYNNVRYLKEAIESVKRQSFTNWELIILDDCSVDDSVALIESFLGDSRIKLIKNKKNQGYIKALKHLISVSNTEILAILDSDDVLEPNAIYEINLAFENNSDCGFLYSQFVFCDEKLNIIKQGFSGEYDQGKNSIHKDYVNHIKAFKKSVYMETEGYQDDMLHAEDRDIILKFEEVTKFIFIDKVLYKYRVVDDSIIHNKKRSLISGISHVKAKYNAYLRRKNSDIPNISRRQMSTEFLRSTLFHLKLHDFKNALQALQKAFLLYPFNIIGYIWFLYRIVRYPFKKIFYRKNYE